ncbi:cold shock domain-containing protein [Pseudonocardia halophobica]|uniref:cold shock domain-containing protein n=1 Tax=Pseudonocardia halophobica TaxID=29401 RepID=UPI003D91A9A9
MEVGIAFVSFPLSVERLQRSVYTVAARDEQEPGMHCGTVAWFDAQRGVGAITVDVSGAEVSVRSTQIDGGGRQSLTAATRVAFTLLDHPCGPRIVDVFVP